MGLFGLGMSIGYIFKYLANKSRGMRPLQKPWEYPLSMIAGGVIMTYYDWMRRIRLE